MAYYANGEPKMPELRQVVVSNSTVERLILESSMVTDVAVVRGLVSADKIQLSAFLDGTVCQLIAMLEGRPDETLTRGQAQSLAADVLGKMLFDAHYFDMRTIGQYDATWLSDGLIDIVNSAYRTGVKAPSRGSVWVKQLQLKLVEW